MDVSIIFNPAAGNRQKKRLDCIVDALNAAGAVVTILPTHQAGDAERYAYDFTHDARKSGVTSDGKRLAVAGGDGTINEAINGLVRAEGGALGIIPLGTANVLALEMGLASHPQAIADAILHGEETAISIGLVNNRAFFLMVGVGFDSQAVANVDLQLKRWTGKGAYAWSALKTWVKNKLPLLDVTIDGTHYSTTTVVVSNAQRYGGASILAPDTDLTSPSFEVCMLKESGRRALLTFAFALAFDRVASLKNLIHVHAHHITIRSHADHGAPVQVDGDAAGKTPLNITLLDGKISLFYPRVRADA